MSAIEDLLRQALQETPAPDPASYPGEQLRRRVRRTQNRLAVAVGLGVVAVVAAVAVPVVALDGGRASQVQVGKSPPPHHHATATAPPTRFWAKPGYGVSCVDLRGRCVFVADTGDTGQRQLVETDLHGRQTGHWSLPMSAEFVSNRNGAAWVWGGGDGGYPQSTLTFVDTNNGQTLTRTQPANDPVADVVLDEQGAAWVATASAIVHVGVQGNALVTLGSVPIRSTDRLVEDPDNGHLWAWSHRDTLTEVIPTSAGGGRTGTTIGSSRQLFAMADSGKLWVRNGPRQLAQLDPTTETAGAPGRLSTGVLDLPGQPELVAPGADGIYVGFSGGGLAYYSTRAVAADGPPTARLAGTHAEVMSVALDGAAIFATYDHEIGRWNPPRRDAGGGAGQPS
jgi:hypothetical protein